MLLRIFFSQPYPCLFSQTNGTNQNTDKPLRASALLADDKRTQSFKITTDYDPICLKL